MKRQVNFCFLNNTADHVLLRIAVHVDSKIQNVVHVKKDLLRWDWVILVNLVTLMEWVIVSLVNFLMNKDLIKFVQNVVQGQYLLMVNV